jgi:hypothetical protein
MVTLCNACDSKGGNSRMSYHGSFSRDKQSLQKFVAEKNGKEIN